MSAKGSRSDYLILAGLALACGIFVLLAALGGVFSETQDVRHLFRTTRSANVEGTIAFYTLLDRLGTRVYRSERPLLEDSLEEMSTLFLIAPAVPVKQHERQALRIWLRSGGVLVCEGSGARALSGLHGIDCRQNSHKKGECSCDRCQGLAEDATKVSEERSELPLARDVSRLHFGSSRTLALAEGKPNRSGTPSDLLLTDSVGVRVAGTPVGKGYVIVLSDSSFLANGLIGKEHNATAAVNLAWYAMSKADGDGLAFDEYHFGFGTHESALGVLTDLLVRTSAGWAVLSLTAAGVLFLIYKGRRFGTRREPTRQRRRSKLEYVYSVASAYRSAAANQLTLRLIFDWFRRRSAQCAGLPRSAPPHDIASGLARRAGKPPARYRAAMRACEDALSQPRLSGHRMSKLLSELATIESEAFDATTRGK
ncbi:MAG: DUF4350 domain-containing protein [Planctomycetota bacterium]|jgi:hypothetical protein